MNTRLKIRGFTLIETMVTVSIILILTAVGIPIYTGYLSDAKVNLAKNSLNSIYLAQTNYYFENNEYYSSGETCGNHNGSIINNLFHGEKVISTDNFIFCIIKNNSGYEAQATQIKGNNQVTIDHLKNITINNDY